MAPTHPGIVIRKQYVEQLKLNKTELAKRLDMSRPHLYSILAGEYRIGAGYAVKFEVVLGIPAEKLLADQAEFDLWQARRSLDKAWIGRPMISSMQMSFAMG